MRMTCGAGRVGGEIGPTGRDPTKARPMGARASRDYRPLGHLVEEAWTNAIQPAVRVSSAHARAARRSPVGKVATLQIEGA